MNEAAMRGFRLSRRAGAITDAVVLPLAHAGIPWALSTLGVRHGWSSGGPGLWNLLGFVPLLAGASLLFWCLRSHFAAAPDGWILERTRHYPTPAYLLTSGPYRYSRNPIYVANGAVWLGWMIFYGSLVVLGFFAAIGAIAGPIVLPREERGLETRFGEVWREYRRATPRWFGRPRRSPDETRHKSAARSHVDVK